MPLIKPMQQRIPYQKSYDVLARLRSWSSGLLLATALVAICEGLLSSQSASPMISSLQEFLKFVSFILIPGYYFVDLYTEAWAYPESARKRRQGFLDNSLGTRLLPAAVEGYYSNDQIESGLYKMTVNCFENCFFTKRIAEEMTSGFVIKTSFFALLFTGSAYFGFKENAMALPIMQVLLSSLCVTELVHHLQFVSRLKNLYERFTAHFQSTNSESDLQRRHEPGSCISFLLDYETTLAFNKAPLSSKIYKKLNPGLTEQWEAIKTRYQIAAP